MSCSCGCCPWESDSSFVLVGPILWPCHPRGLLWPPHSHFITQRNIYRKHGNSLISYTIYSPKYGRKGTSPITWYKYDICLASNISSTFYSPMYGQIKALPWYKYEEALSSCPRWWWYFTSHLKLSCVLGKVPQMSWSNDRIESSSEYIYR